MPQRNRHPPDVCPLASGQPQSAEVRKERSMASDNSSVLKNAVVAGSSICMKPNIVYVDVGVNDFKNWCDFIDRVADGHQDRRCPWVFRGQANAEWAVKNSFDRSLNRIEITPAYYRIRDVEQELLCEENDYFVGFTTQVNKLPDSIRPKKKTSLGWFALMQHYRVPTRLIDFTRNPFFALYFAVEDGNTDYSIWMINAFRISNRSHWPQGFGERNTCKDWDVLMHENGIVAENIWNNHDAMFSENAVPDKEALFLELSSGESNERIEAQEGLFMMPLLLSISSGMMFNRTLVIPFRDHMKDFNRKFGFEHVKIMFDEFLSKWHELSQRDNIMFRFDKNTRKLAIRNGLLNRGITPKLLFPKCEYAYQVEQIARTLALEHRARDIRPLSPFAY